MGALRVAESESPRDADPCCSSESLADSAPFGSRATVASGLRRTEREDVLGDALRSVLSSRSRLLPPKPDPVAVSRSFTRSTNSTPAATSLSVSLGEAAPGAARVEQLASSASSSKPITSTRSELVVSTDARAATGCFARLVCARGRGRNGEGGGGGSAAIVEGAGTAGSAALSQGGTRASRASRARRWRSRASRTYRLGLDARRGPLQVSKVVERDAWETQRRTVITAPFPPTAFRTRVPTTAVPQSSRGAAWLTPVASLAPPRSCPRIVPAHSRDDHTIRRNLLCAREAKTVEEKARLAAWHAA